MKRRGQVELERGAGRGEEEAVIASVARGAGVVVGEPGKTKLQAQALKVKARGECVPRVKSGAGNEYRRNDLITINYGGQISVRGPLLTMSSELI